MVLVDIFLCQFLNHWILNRIVLDISDCITLGILSCCDDDCLNFLTFSMLSDKETCFFLNFIFIMESETLLLYVPFSKLRKMFFHQLLYHVPERHGSSSMCFKKLTLDALRVKSVCLLVIHFNLIFVFPSA